MECRLDPYGFSYIEDSIKEPPGTEFPGGFFYSDQFGVPGRVLRRFTQVVATSNDSAILNNNAADRHLILGLRLAGFGDGAAHPLFVGAGQGGFVMVVGE